MHREKASSPESGAPAAVGAPAPVGVPPVVGELPEPVGDGLLAFSRCMRANGVPDYPDPQPGASRAKILSAQQLGVSSSQLSAAENTCQHLLPVGNNDQFPPAEVPPLLIGMREFSQCVRSHGEPNWPDPILDSEGRPVFDLGAHGITRGDFHSPRVQTEIAECQHLLPSAFGGGTPVGGS